ncbi:MAG: hypothetical protein IT450_24270 [Phycisphaerales bacterium]|nr:hypothetical protein [Phycisphaerales bacterium]
MAQTPQAGKVAIVEIATQGARVLMIEVALDGETLTISDEHQPLTVSLREAAERLIAQVKEDTHNG